MSFELWDTDTRNMVAVFDSEQDALQAVRELVAINTPAYPASLALVFEDADGETTMIARGSSLETRARLVK